MHHVSLLPNERPCHCFASRPHMTSAYDLGHYYILVFVFAFAFVDTGSTLVLSVKMNDRSEKGRTAAPSGRREIPRSLIAEAGRDETTRAPPAFASLSSFTISLSSYSLFALIRHHLSLRANARNWTSGQPSIISIYGWTKVRYPIYLVKTRSVRQPLNTQAVGNYIQLHLHQ